MDPPTDYDTLGRPDRPEPNDDHDPGARERILLDILGHEGRANPWLLRKWTGWRGQDINDHLNMLVAAKWVTQPPVYDREQAEWVDAYALYQFNAYDVYEPRPLDETLAAIEDGDGPTTDAPAASNG